MKVLGDGWTAVTKDGSLSAHFEHTVAVTKNGPLVHDAGRTRVDAGGGSDGRWLRPGVTAPSRSKARCSKRCPTGCTGWGSSVSARSWRTRRAEPGRNFIRVLIGDRVRMELSPRDLTRGRIVAVVRPR